MERAIRYRKTNRKRLIELFERIGYKVTKQSTDGTYMLLRLKDNVSSQYWLFEDRIEHRLPDFVGGAYFFYKDCIFEIQGNTVNVFAKDNPSVFLQFTNHDYKPQAKKG